MKKNLIKKIIKYIVKGEEESMKKIIKYIVNGEEESKKVEYKEHCSCHKD